MKHKMVRMEELGCLDESQQSIEHKNRVCLMNVKFQKFLKIRLNLFWEQKGKFIKTGPLKKGRV